MPYLRGKTCYLSGAIEYQRDLSWRGPVITTLSQQFGLAVFDPHSDPKQQWFQPLVDAKQNRDWESVRQIAKSFVRKDLAMVDRADIVIAYLPKGIPTTGTHHEIINANNAKKPVLLVGDGKENVSSWYYGFIPHEVIFDSFSHLYAYLQEVEDGKHKDNNRWSFVYGLV